MKPSEQAKNIDVEVFSRFRKIFGQALSGSYWSVNNVSMMIVGSFGIVMLANGVLKSNGNLIVLIHAIMPLVFVIKVIGQTINYFMGSDRKSTKAISEMVDFIVEHEQNLAYYSLLDKRLKFICQLVKNFIVLLAVLYCIPILNSIIATLINGKAIYAVYVIMPLVDEKSAHGYCLNTFMQCFLIAIVFMCHTGISSAQTYQIPLIIPKVDIFVSKLQVFGQELQNFDDQGWKILQKAVRKSNKVRLIEIIKFYNHCNDYIVTCQDCHGLSLFFAISVNSIGIALSLIIAYKLSVFVGLSFLLILLCEISIPCILGTIVKHENERIVNAIYDFPFYDLKVADQKIFLQFLMIAQDSIEIRLPHFGAVNLELLADVLNGGYSYFMFILNFL